MKLRSVLGIIVAFPLFSFASSLDQRPPLLGDDKDKPKMATNSDIDSVDLVASDTLSSIDSILPASEEILVQESSIDIYEIVEFEFNEIPVTEELFNYHVGTMQFQIPMEFNYLVKTQIDYYGTRWQVKLKEMISKSEYFFPFYEEVLAENNMPSEIKYLSIIESGLNPYARSRSGAVGAWQFMPATGRIFDLHVTSKVDERRSLEKSTRAACLYLKQMYNLYDDWLVALASYNCGPGNVRKAIRLSGRRDFWGMYNYLPRETQNYVPKFIAMTYMMNFYGEYGITPVPVDASLYMYDRVYCNQGLNFKVIAEHLGMTSEDLMHYNPEMKVPQIPYKNGGYMLNVPVDRSYLFYEYLNQLGVSSTPSVDEPYVIASAYEAPQTEGLTYSITDDVKVYTVKSGESLPYIARNFNVTVSELKSWNGITGNVIHPKQKLKIYK